LFIAVGAALVVALAVSACGSSSKGGGKNGGTATLLFGTAADSLDPGFGYTTQAAEPDWIVYTPLLTYGHAEGTAGGQLIPGLATSLPQVSADRLTYTLTLRTGLVYSNGTPVKASDFPYSLERAMKLNWGGKSFYTNFIAGAAAYDSGKAKSISGITADDATGKITIKLLKTSPYGAFPNVLAFPSSGLVPSGTPMTNMPNNPPPGDGPYTFSSVTPNKGYTMVQNPHWARQNIPGIPVGHIKKFVIQYVSTPQQEATEVLNNQADSFDPADEIPGSLLTQIQSQASNRFKEESTAQNFYFFLNVTNKPFSSQLAREAVVYALDYKHLASLAAGFLEPACFFLPPQLIGHPTGPCPYRDPNSPPDLAKAKALVQQSGMAGTAITVWGENQSPRKEYIDYYTSVLNQIGFKATEKLTARAVYFTTVQNLKLHPQTGFADWQQDFPNPIDFYLLLDGRSIQPVNNPNMGEVNDPRIESELSFLEKFPGSQLSQVAGRWQALDTYQAQKAYSVVYGYNKSPEFVSNRINFGSVVFHPVYFGDWTSWSLK
jgi:peptide/nickel transport system substrate-binding protein